MTSFDDVVAAAKVVTDETLDLAGCRVRLVSNVAGFPALRHFARRARRQRAPGAEFELCCVSLAEAGLTAADVVPYVDDTARARSFRAGYYVTDHFGAPAYVVSRGRRIHVFGERLERVVWPYFVKYVLSRHALERGLLHLKAAAFAIGSAGTLVVGRGGGGKTLLASQMCLRGARFVTNSHALVGDGRLRGMSSTIRLRPDPWTSSLTEAAAVDPALAQGEVLLDPDDAFEVADEPVGLRNVCIVEHGGGGPGIAPLDAEDAYECAEQFALALNVYRLEEDLLDLSGRDPVAFARHLGEMKERLRRSVMGARCLLVTADMLDAAVQDELLDALDTREVTVR